MTTSRPSLLRRLGLAAVLCLGLGVCLPQGSSLEAAPVDARVGATRATYKTRGTVLRAEPKVTSPVVGSPLAKGTLLYVEEVNLPWLKVRATTSAGIVSGYLRAFETVEPSALQRNAAPAPGSASGARVRQSDVSAAGRQFDATIERNFRASRRDLAIAYQQLDQVERTTATMDPGESIEFLMEGRLGLRGRDFARPGRLPADPRARPARGSSTRRGSTRRRPRRSGGLRLPGGLGGGGLGPLDDILDDAGVDKDFREGILGGLEGIINAERTRAKQLSERFTPEQEYWLGRAVAAQAIAKYGLDPDQGRQAYVRLVGEALVRASNRVPPNFGGYHFIVLNSDQINGLSGPGGFICVTRGAVMACQTEDDLAGILGHELGHVTRKHGERVLRQRPAFQSAIGGLVGFVGGLVGKSGWEGRLAGQLLKTFEVSVSESFKIAQQNGYGRTLEFEADQEGTWLLVDVYYDHASLRNMLLRLPQHGGSATHASPMVRAQALEGVLARYRPFTPREGVKEARLARFQARGLGGSSVIVR